MPDVIDTPDETQTDVLTEKSAIIAGAVAGCLAPLTTVAVSAFNKKSDLNLTDVPWVLMFAFAFIGAIVVFFLAERKRRHVFTYAIAAPFIVLGILKTHDANVAQSNIEEKKAEIRIEEKKNAVLLSAYDAVKLQAKQTELKAEKDILSRPGESLSYPPEQEAAVDFENPSL